MLWIYLSPHLDDAVFSCGGLIHHQALSGDFVEIWTICAGDPPEGDLSSFAASLHQRWETGRDAVEKRRQEDKSACQVVGAKAVHFSVPDCIYRRSPDTDEPLYTSEEMIFGVLDPSETPMIDQLANRIQEKFPGHGDYRVVSPLAIGGHVDHVFTRRIAEGWSEALYYYADFPYSLGIPLDTLDDLQPYLIKLTPADLEAWQNAIREYPTQLSTFWENETDMVNAVQEYHRMRNSTYIWHSNP